MTNQEIKTVGQTIAQETQIGGNTAARVGGVVEGIGVALDNKDAANGYYQATINGGTITVNAPNYLLGSGGNLRIKMPSAGTTASTLTIGNANAVQLWYNGAAVSAQNTWDATEIISVFYDGTRFMASNSQGGGGDLKVKGAVADLDITDENNHVLARFEDGEFKVKNFDTSKVKIETGNGDILSDLDITDENGHVLARFQNGNIKTKYFNSRKYADMPSGGYENFLVQVNGYIADNNSTTGNLQDSISMEYDRCIINLPPNYNPVGEPVRLIIAGQGSSGQIQSSTTKAYWTMPLVDTILSEGYAVMQVNGTPGYTDGIASYGGMGTPQYLQSVIAAYNYVINKYNIKKDGVFLSGWSQGTLKTWQIAANLQCFIPVKAAVFFGFADDLWKGLYANFPQTAREYMTENFGFVEKEANKYVLEIFSNIYSAGDTVTKPTTYSSAKTVPTDYEFAYILNNYDKWLGYDPICWGTSKNIISEQFRYRSWVADSNPNEDSCFQDVANIVPCPTKIFVGTSDTSTPLKIANWYKTMADNAGVLCDLRIYQGGNHSYPSSYQTIQVSTRYGGNITTNVPSWEGMLFLERYDY